MQEQILILRTKKVYQSQKKELKHIFSEGKREIRGKMRQIYLLLTKNKTFFLKENKNILFGKKRKGGDEAKRTGGGAAGLDR